MLSAFVLAVLFVINGQTLRLFGLHNCKSSYEVVLFYMRPIGLQNCSKKQIGIFVFCREGDLSAAPWVARNSMR